MYATVRYGLSIRLRAYVCCIPLPPTWGNSCLYTQKENRPRPRQKSASCPLGSPTETSAHRPLSETASHRCLFRTALCAIVDREMTFNDTLLQGHRPVYPHAHGRPENVLNVRKSINCFWIPETV